MSRNRSIASFALAIALLALGRALPAQTLCAPSSITATQLLEYYTGLVTGADSDAVHARNAYKLLPAPASEVRMETIAAVCDSAALAYGRLLAPADAAPAPVWVIRAGPSRYIVFNFAYSGRAGTLLVVFDATFQDLSMIASGVGALSSHRSPLPPVIPPSDLHLVSASDGHAKFAWTTSATDVTSYRLQRAVDSGPYAFAGDMLGGAARSATDTAARNGHAYRYRIVAYRAVTGVETSNVVTVTLTEVGSVTRAATGLLFPRRACLPPDSLTSVVQAQAIRLVSTADAGEARTAFGLPAGTAADVSIVQNDSVCAAVVGGFETTTRRVFADSFVVVRIFEAAPFYLIAPLRGVPTPHYLLGPQSRFAGILGAVDNTPSSDLNSSPPPDLHTTAALDGLVELAWTSTATVVSGYRLQRATGSGQFRFVGGVLPGSARSAVDTSAHPGAPYRYRLAEWRSGPTAILSNDVTVTITDPGPHSRPSEAPSALSQPRVKTETTRRTRLETT